MWQGPWIYAIFGSGVVLTRLVQGRRFLESRRLGPVLSKSTAFPKKPPPILLLYGESSARFISRIRNQAALNDGEAQYPVDAGSQYLSFPILFSSRFEGDAMILNWQGG